MTTYDHKQIESKWQKYWDENRTFCAEVDRSKPKHYVLDMFPYPSGAGLHVGHVIGYTATDIIARYKRMKGFNVLHPMGWDSFGLPAEQYAVRTGIHPAVTTKKNIETYRRQLKSLGFSYDWSKELATSSPDYYKWTQWIFTKLCEKGLAYEAEVSVNYCPFLGTVLANEEVDNGKSKEGGHPVIQKPLKQWMFKITAYADRLLEDLELIDWPHSVKTSQINWIGKSEGATIHFVVPEANETITVYTTCQDTIFGATFLVLAPEHPLALKIAGKDHRVEVEAYLEKAKAKKDLDRTDLNREKTGIYTGAYAINPATGKKIPIWIADYVLATYGTGAIMGVPGHCERDFDFAKKHDLPIVDVIIPSVEAFDAEGPHHIEFGEFCQKVKNGQIVWTGDGILCNSQNGEISLNGKSAKEAKKAVIVWLEKKGYGEKKIQFKLRDWLFSRQRYWGEPIPILHFEDGSYRTLDVDELPLTLPEIHDFKPSGDGQSPLAKATDWVFITDPKTGKRVRRETNTMPNWAGSCWYYLRFCDPHNDSLAWDKEKENYWMPVDLYVGGVEHAVLHLLYARFWHKVLYDCGLVSTKEPFSKLRNQGLIIARSYRNNQNLYVLPEDVVEKEGKYFSKTTGEELQSQIEKMSKSKLNGLAPDEIIEEYGADALRVYEMFMGPIEKEKLWNTDAVAACRRFLARIYDIATSDKLTDEETPESLRLAHRLIAKVAEDMELLQFNTSIAKMMEFVNEFSKFEKYPKKALVTLVQLLSPFAPHISEELWQILGQKSALSFTPYPIADPQFLQDEVVTYVVQVNGKLRARLDLPRDQTQDVIVTLAQNHPNVSKFLDGKAIQKVVFVPNKLLNLVVS